MKYEFVPGDEITTPWGVKLKRIRALVAITALGVASGDLGGYIESEKNLDHVSGNAWVSDDAQVYGDAWVYGNARVYGNAQVYGDAHVYDDAQVYGDAHVYGNARVSDDAQVYGNARVYGDAQVYGNAWVSDDARVYGNARVYDDAWVSDDAWVYGNAWVSGNARVSGNAWVYGDKLIFWASKVGRDNGTLTVFNSKDNTLTVTRGCFIGSIDEFLTKSEIEHDDQTHIEYRMLIEVAHSRITRAQTKEPS